MLIPHFEFEYTFHGMTYIDNRCVSVSFITNSRIIDPKKQYECKVLAGNEIYLVLGADILEYFVYHSKLMNQHYQEIPRDKSINEVLKMLKIPIQTT